MSKADINYKYSKKCISNLPCAFITRPNDGNNGLSKIVMTSISESEEKELLEKECIYIKRGKFEFKVLLSLTYLLGDCDLSPESETLNILEKSNWLNKLYVQHFIPSNYDFNNHLALSNEFDRMHRWTDYDTCNPKIFVPFLWNTINRPTKVVIFKDYHTTEYMKKQEEYIKNRREKRKQEHKSVTEEKYYQKAQRKAFESKLQRANLKIN